MAVLPGKHSDIPGTANTRDVAIDVFADHALLFHAKAICTLIWVIFFTC